MTLQLGILLGVFFALRGLPLVESIRMAAVIVALVPQGLFFMTTVAYAMGAVRVAGQGALIQQTNAVESTSYVTLLCLDKTGTLTTNRITLHAIRLVDKTLGDDETMLKCILGDYAASTSSGNRTTAAIHQAFGRHARSIRAEVPFSSQRKWSALDFDDPARPGAYSLGAPEILSPSLRNQGILPRIEDWTSQGLRVLLFAHYPGLLPVHEDKSEPQLPSGLIPLALLSFRDELRQEAHSTLQHFSELHVGFKIISGDNPQAVAALARQVGLGDDLRVVSGLDLDSLDDVQLGAEAREAAVFGRITPRQKERLVRRVRQQFGQHLKAWFNQ